MTTAASEGVLQTEFQKNYWARPYGNIRHLFHLYMKMIRKTRLNVHESSYKKHIYTNTSHFQSFLFQIAFGFFYLRLQLFGCVFTVIKRGYTVTHSRQ